LRFNNTFTVLPKWSPRGAMLAYQTNVPGSADDDETAIERVLPGDSPVPDVRSSFVSGELMYDFAWSADGQWFAMTGLNGARPGEHILQRRHPDGSDPLTLDTSNTPYAYLGWSPDGEWISFVRRHGDSSAVYLVRSNGGVVRRVTTVTGLYLSPAWSPDGGTLVYAGFFDDGKSVLYQFNLADDSVRPLFESNAFIHHVAWASAGDWIYFASGSREQAQLYQIRPQGGEPAYLTDTAFDWEVPVSSPISLKLRSEFALLAGLLLAMVGVAPYPRNEAPPVPIGRRFVLKKLK
jgi:Tol biopolymer transport system component